MFLKFPGNGINNESQHQSGKDVDSGKNYIVLFPEFIDLPPEHNSEIRNKKRKNHSNIIQKEGIFAEGLFFFCAGS